MCGSHDVKLKCDIGWRFGDESVTTRYGASQSHNSSFNNKQYRFDSAEGRERENRIFSRRSREKHLAQTPKLFLFTRTSTFYFECVWWKSVCRSEAIHTHSSEINSDEIFLGWHFSYLSFFRTNCGMKMCVWVCVLCLRMFWCGMSFTIQYDVLRYFANSMEKFCWFGFRQSLMRNGYTFAYLLDWGASEASINGTAKSTATTWNALCLCDG